MKRLFLVLLLFLAVQSGCVTDTQQNGNGGEQNISVSKDCVGCYEEENSAAYASEIQIGENVSYELSNLSGGVEENKTNETTGALQQPQPENNGPDEKMCEGPTEPDILTASSVKYGGEVYADQCVQWNTIKEYYCRDGEVKNGNLNCPPGYWCKNGACIEFVGSCTDSDGNDTQKRGYVSVVVSPFSSETEHDECEDGATVREWVCNESQGFALLLECGSGFKCAEGKCVRSKCKDTDNGIEPKVYGEIGNELETAHDSCIDDEVLREYYCYGDSIKYKDITCADKCIDDSCMPKQE